METVGGSVLLNPPRQVRSRETLRRILAAARSLLEEREFAEITIDDIVERADSSKGSFYQRFRDKESLLVYLLEQEHDAATAAWSEFLDPVRWRASSLQTVMDAFLDRLLQMYRDRPSFMRAYAGQVLGSEGRIRTLSVRLSRHVLTRLRRVVAEKAPELGHPDGDAATGFLLTVLVTLLPPLFLSPSQDLFPQPMSHDRLEHEVRVLVSSYLGIADRTG